MYNIPQVKLSYVTERGTTTPPRITNSKATMEILKSIFDHETIEHVEYFYCLLLNRHNKVLGVHLVSMGGITGTVVDIRVIFQAAILANACSIVLSHNHPSGNTAPSTQDIDITRKIKEAGKYMDITVLDHIIISAEGNYYSFADEGIM